MESGVNLPPRRSTHDSYREAKHCQCNCHATPTLKYKSLPMQQKSTLPSANKQSLNIADLASFEFYESEQYALNVEQLFMLSVKVEQLKKKTVEKAEAGKSKPGKKEKVHGNVILLEE